MDRLVYSEIDITKGIPEEVKAQARALMEAHLGHPVEDDPPPTPEQIARILQTRSVGVGFRSVQNRKRRGALVDSVAEGGCEYLNEKEEVL